MAYLAEGRNVTMSNREIIEKWLSAFGRGVDRKMIEEHVTSHGNHLWHLFSWCEVECLEGENARKAFDDLQYDQAVKFCDGYSNRIRDVENTGKISSRQVDKFKESDVYIVANDFSWTYVRTHETGICGPYFARVK